jgi:hypothetical protein
MPDVSDCPHLDPFEYSLLPAVDFRKIRLDMGLTLLIE